jgi:hypothetical protein
VEAFLAKSEYLANSYGPVLIGQQERASPDLGESSKVSDVVTPPFPTIEDRRV